MSLERKTNESGSVTITMHECPVCNEEFDHGNSRFHHIMNAHDPTDFNLSALWDQ